MKYLQTGAKAVQRGFTLIELMIVVAIIAVLATVALPAYTNYTVRAQITEGLLAASDAKLAISEAYTTNANDGLVAAVGSLGNVSSKFVNDVSVNNTTGIITIRFGNSVNPAIDGRTITLTPMASVNGNFVALTADTTGMSGIDWGCASDAHSVGDTQLNTTLTAGNVAARYAPSTCQ